MPRKLGLKGDNNLLVIRSVTFVASWEEMSKIKDKISKIALAEVLHVKTL